jgi:hypothetical protein
VQEAERGGDRAAPRDRHVEADRGARREVHAVALALEVELDLRHASAELGERHDPIEREEVVAEQERGAGGPPRARLVVPERERLQLGVQAAFPQTPAPERVRESDAVAQEDGGDAGLVDFVGVTAEDGDSVSVADERRDRVPAALEAGREAGLLARRAGGLGRDRAGRTGAEREAEHREEDGAPHATPHLPRPPRSPTNAAGRIRRIGTS